MSHPYAEEIEANLARAERTLKAAALLRAAALLLEQAFFDSATSRAYYAAFHAATAAVLYERETFKKHGSLISAFHRLYVKPGRIPQKHGKPQPAFRVARPRRLRPDRARDGR